MHAFTSFSRTNLKSFYMELHHDKLPYTSDKNGNYNMGKKQDCSPAHKKLDIGLLSNFSIMLCILLKPSILIKKKRYIFVADEDLHCGRGQYVILVIEAMVDCRSNVS